MPQAGRRRERRPRGKPPRGSGLTQKPAARGRWLGMLGVAVAAEVACDARGDPEDEGVVGHVSRHYRPGRDDGSRTDTNSREDHYVRGEPSAVADLDWTALGNSGTHVAATELMIHGQ